jgi:F-type H+-transporting ATPase subunit b|tara:strand:+ start:579 stop:1064 length:486 start_codon:yes stop_codon:yes gene_type:complete
MFSDPQFWVAIAFIIFIIAIFNPVRKILNSSLDNKINEIKESIKEAEDLKKDTESILNEIIKRQNAVELEIKEIHSNSKDRIKILESQAQIKLSEQISKRELSAKAKIEQMVRDTNLLIQKHISETAINATVTILEKKLNGDEKQNLINESIKELESVLKN